MLGRGSIQAEKSQKEQEAETGIRDKYRLDRGVLFWTASGEQVGWALAWALGPEQARNAKCHLDFQARSDQSNLGLKFN